MHMHTATLLLLLKIHTLYIIDDSKQLHILYTYYIFLDY